MKTVRFFGVLLISFSTIFIGGAYCNYFPIKVEARIETPEGDNKYSPAGEWLSIKNREVNQGEVTLFVPDFIINCHSRLLDPGAGMGQYNDILVYTNSRRALYKELFLEIMLMTTSGNHQFEYEISKPLNSSIKEVNYTIKMLGEIKVIPKSSNLLKELPVQLKLVGLLFTVQDKVNEAGAEAASIYTSLLAFRDFRYKFLKSQITKNSNHDPEMLVGLELAYNELIGMQTKELTSLKKQLETNSGLESASSGLVKMAIGIQFGKVVSAIAGGGLLGVSLATAASTAWFWQLDRTYDAKKAEASVVLLSSIDRTLFENIKPSVSPADNYSIEQMHSHLSIMIYEAANVYNNKSSVQYNFKLPMRDWINGFPYYDFAELALMKQKAINDIEILQPDKEQFAAIKHQEIESRIIELMGDELYLNEYHPTRKDCVWFEYYDLNKDGNEEVFVWNHSMAGAQNAPIVIWETKPLRKISEELWGDDVKVSEERTNGYRNVIIPYYVSGQAYTPSLRGMYFDLRWDKSKKVYVEVN